MDERERRHLQEALVRAIGEEPADTLVAYLPPAGWADVADLVLLKQDLDAGRTRLRRDLDLAEIRLRVELQTRIATVKIELHDGLRTNLYWTIAAAPRP